MNGKGRNVLVGWGYQARRKGVSPSEFFEDIHTTNTSEQVREDVWVDWFWGAFIDQETTEYSVQAQSVSLLYGRVIQLAATGSVAAQSVGVRKDSLISLSTSITVTGISVNLNYVSDATLIPDTISYTVSTGDLTLKHDKVLGLSTSVSVSGSADLLHAKKLGIAYSGIAVTNQEANLQKAIPFNVDTISYSVSGSVSFKRDYLVSVGTSCTATVTGSFSRGTIVRKTRVKIKYWK